MNPWMVSLVTCCGQYKRVLTASWIEISPNCCETLRRTCAIVGWRKKEFSANRKHFDKLEPYVETDCIGSGSHIYEENPPKGFSRGWGTPSSER